MESGLMFKELREADIARMAEWSNGEGVTLTYQATELAGEVGEACNIIKKIERERLGFAGSRATVEQLEDELADIVICVDLLAMQFDIDLESAIPRKFNKTTDKIGAVTRMRENG